MNYHLTTLDSGLRVASETLPGMESATLAIAINVGARHELPQEHGIAHLLEHMAFKGTARRNARQIAEEFDSIGGHINAYTSMEQTVYYARVLAEHIPVAMDILADILQHSVFDQTELQREQEVIVQEIGMHHDSPEDLVFDYLHDVTYPDHTLGRSILGTTETVRGFTADDIRAYMGRHYHAPSMVISAAGKITHAELLPLVQQHFTHLGEQPCTTHIPATYHSGEKRVERNELEQLQLMLAYESFGLNDPDHYPAQLLSTIFGGGMSSRLFQEVRENRGLAYSVQSFLTTYRDCGFFGIYAATGAEKSAELQAVLVEECTKLLAGVSEVELTRAKNQQKASILMRKESPTSVAETIARHLQDYGSYRDTAELLAKVEAITAADLQRVAQRIFGEPRRALATLGPAAE